MGLDWNKRSSLLTYGQHHLLDHIQWSALLRTWQFSITFTRIEESSYLCHVDERSKSHLAGQTYFGGRPLLATVSGYITVGCTWVS